MVARQQVRHYEEQYRAFQEFEERERREKEAVVIDPMQQLQAAVARQQQQSQGIFNQLSLDISSPKQACPSWTTTSSKKAS